MPRIRTLFTTRRGGVSAAPYASLNLGGAVGDSPTAVGTNRSLVADRIGLTASRLVWMRQVHGTTVRLVEAPEPDPLPDCDGIVTTATDVALGVLAADCVPILAADRCAGVVGAAHAGRRGAAGGIARRLIEVMVGAGADPGDVTVWLGPAICGRCYEVPSDMQGQVERDLPGSACETDRGTAGLDLRAGLRRQLIELGVRAVDVDSRCTHTDPDLFSHRRGAPTGRQAGLIWRSP